MHRDGEPALRRARDPHALKSEAVWPSAPSPSRPNRSAGARAQQCGELTLVVVRGLRQRKLGAHAERSARRAAQAPPARVGTDGSCSPPRSAARGARPNTGCAAPGPRAGLRAPARETPRSGVLPPESITAARVPARGATRRADDSASASSSAARSRNVERETAVLITKAGAAARPPTRLHFERSAAAQAFQGRATCPAGARRRASPLRRRGAPGRRRSRAGCRRAAVRRAARGCRRRGWR